MTRRGSRRAVIAAFLVVPSMFLGEACAAAVGPVRVNWNVYPAASSFEPGDPIRAAHVLELAERTFPSLTTELDSADLLERGLRDPRTRGNLRGRLAEEMFERRSAADGWRRVGNPIAPQNDFWNGGRGIGAQVKVHADINDYHGSMRTDHLAEHFVIPDDHYDALKRNLIQKREEAIRGGQIARAHEYARQEARLRKLGWTFAQLDGAVSSTASHYREISTALRQAGNATSFLAAAVMIIEGGIAVHEFASGKDDVLKLATKLGKAGVTGLSAAVLSTAAVNIAIAAGATGNVPTVVAIVAGTATILVVDWAYDRTAESLSVAVLTPKQRADLWAMKGEQ